MSRSKCLLLLILLLCGGILAAQTQPLSPAPTVELSVTLIPNNPSLSFIQVLFPFHRWTAAVWYLADSAWFIPQTYMEAGAAVRFAWIRGGQLALSSGLGTIFSLQTRSGEISVPLYVDGLLHYTVRDWLAIQAQLEFLLYGNGFGATGRIKAWFLPFRFGLLLGIGIGYGWMAEWNFNPAADQFQIYLSLGYEL